MFSSEWRISPAHFQMRPDISLWSLLVQARSKRAERGLGLAARYLTTARRMLSASARFSSARLVMLRILRPEMSSSGVSPGRVGQPLILPPRAFDASRRGVRGRFGGPSARRSVCRWLDPQGPRYLGLGRPVAARVWPPAVRGARRRRFGIGM